MKYIDIVVLRERVADFQILLARCSGLKRDDYDEILEVCRRYIEEYSIPCERCGGTGDSADTGPCEVCGGGRFSDKSDKIKCPDCKGCGEILEEIDESADDEEVGTCVSMQSFKCLSCKGRGYLDNSTGKRGKRNDTD